VERAAFCAAVRFARVVLRHKAHEPVYFVPQPPDLCLVALRRVFLSVAAARACALICREVTHLGAPYACDTRGNPHTDRWAESCDR
jgi:hypothetical protein